MRNAILAFLMFVMIPLGSTQIISRFQFNPTKLDVDGVVSATNLAAGVNMNLSGAFVATGIAVFATPARLGVYAVASEATNYFNFYGYDRRGNHTVEAITGPIAGAVARTRNNYSSVYRIAPSSNMSGNVTVGPCTRANTALVEVPFSKDGHLVAIQILNGSSNIQVQGTFRDTSVLDPTLKEDSMKWYNFGPVVTSDMIVDVTAPVNAIRLEVNFGDATENYSHESFITIISKGN